MAKVGHFGYDGILVIRIQIYVFLLLCAGISNAAVSLDLIQKFQYLGPHLEILVDADSSLKASEVLSLPSSSFQTSKTDAPSLGLSQKPVWVRVDLQSQTTRTVYLELDAPLAEGVEMYVDTGLDSTQALTRQPRSYLHWNHVFPIQIQSGQSMRIALKLRSPRNLQVPLRLWDQYHFFQYNHQTMMYKGLYLGILMGISILVLLSYLTFRENLYLYFLSTIGAFCLFLFFHDGIGQRFFIPGLVMRYSQVLAVFSTLLILIAELEFSRKYLNTAGTMPRYDAWFRRWTVALVLTLVLSIVVEPFWMNHLIPIVGVITLCGIFLVATSRLGKDPQAKWFLIGMFPPFIVGCGMFVQASGLIHRRILTFDHYYWAFLLMVVLIGFVLGRRLRNIQQEKMDLKVQLVANLKNADILKDEFLANTSHELKTPLNGIIGITEGMLGNKRSPLPIKVQRSLHLIVTCGHRLSNLINDILDYSRLKNGDIKLNSKPVSIRQVTGIVFSILAPLAKKKNLDLRNLVSPDLPNALADEDRMQQILLNLVGNAVKFTESGHVAVIASVVNGMIQVTVEDSGIGIPKDNQETIFEMFHQVDGSISRNYGGTGIGLSLSRKLLQLQGGQIWVESQEGRGAQFHFTVPLSDGSAAVAIVNEATISGFVDDAPEIDLAMVVKSSVNGASVLLVDDEPVNLQVLINQLSMDGFDLWIASSGKEALTIIEEKGPPSLMLLDLMMPGLSGYDVCLQLRQKYSASVLPIIILSAKNQAAEFVRGLELGANDFLSKPFSKQELLARVKVHLSLANLHKAYMRFVPQEFLEQMGRSNIAEVSLGDQLEQYMAVLVTDIRDFTTISEQISPAQTFTFLNEYLERMAPLIRSNGGFVSKFMGDAIVALFPGGAKNALQASGLIMQELEDYNREQSGLLKKPIRIGMGIQVGKAILGTVGFKGRMDVTVVSRKIGQATLFERLTKLYGCDIVISGDVLRLSKELVPTARLLGRIRQAGPEPWLEFHEVLGIMGRPADGRKLASCATFEKGVRLSWERDWDHAMDCFGQVLQLNPHDRGARVYLDFCKNSESRLGFDSPQQWDETAG